MKRVIQLLTLALFAIFLMTAISFADDSSTQDSHGDASTINTLQGQNSESQSGLLESLLEDVIILIDPYTGNVIVIENTQGDDEDIEGPGPPGRYSTGPELDDNGWVEDLQ